MSIKSILLIFAFLITPNLALADNHLAVATISDSEKSEISQEVETMKSGNSSESDKLVLKEINKKSKGLSVITIKRTVTLIVIIVLLVILVKFIFK